MANKLNDETWLQHRHDPEMQGSNRPLVSPIYQNVKFTHGSYSDFFRWEGYFYSRVSNPTVRGLELELAHLQQRADAICVATGVAAIALPLLALLKQGDHVILFTESYAPSRYLIQTLMAGYGVTHTLLHLREVAQLQKHVIVGKTKLILFESPTNPSVSVPNINEIVTVAKQNKILTLMDNTFAGPHQHGEFAIDIFVHSLTKYASGHGDVMGGAVIASQELIQQMRTTFVNVGATLDPHAAFLIQRGMKTYFLRYRAQCERALKVAQFLESDSRVKNLRYPGCVSHPDHLLAKQQMRDFGNIISFDLDAKISMEAFVSRLQIFVLAASLGSTESLIAPCKPLYRGSLSEHELIEAHINDQTVRLSVGLEDPSDLMLDLKNSLGG